MKTEIKRTLAAVTAALTVAAMPGIAAFADFAWVEIGYLGDIDEDNTVGIADAVTLSRYLIGEAEISAERTQFADMDKNGVLNAVDLTLLKRVVFGYTEPEMLYTEVEIEDPPAEETLMDAPINVLSPTVLSKGTNHLIMFVVDFPDCKFKQSFTAEQIKELSFGAANPQNQYYPLESVIGYYQRASYGALNMEADVFTYTAKNNIGSYVGKTDSLVEEIMSAFDSQLDYNNYDVNHDGIMDTILLSVADNASDDDWWPCSGGYYGNKYFDGVRGGNVIFGNASPLDVEYYNNTWIHELGHAMGLPDYYKYKNTENGYYGLNGDAGTEMMDDAFGDMCAFSKLMYGWYTPSQVQIYTGGTQTFTLESSQQAPGCILIPRGDVNGYLSEYMLLEYATHEGNNATWWLFNEGGIRAMHVEATVTEGYWGPEFKWNNYGMNYDESNERQRVIRLANEAEGGSFFRTGSVINGNISGFHWYDSNGYQTVETGITITVGELVDGKYTITISQ